MKKIIYIIFLSFIISACSYSWNDKQQDIKSYRSITTNDTVVVSYKLIQSWVVLEKQDHFQLRIGDHKPFIGLEQAILGMKINEKRSVKLETSELYGDERIEQIVRKSQLIKESESDTIAPFTDETFSVGSTAPWNGKEMRIEKIEGEYITISYPRPHPLAGKSLTLEVEVKSVE